MRYVCNTRQHVQYIFDIEQYISDFHLRQQSRGGKPGRFGGWTKIGDVHAEHAPEGLVNPAVSCGAKGEEKLISNAAHSADPTSALHAAPVMNVELPPAHPPRAVSAHEAASVHGERVHLGDVAAQRRRQLELPQVEEVQVAPRAARHECVAAQRERARPRGAPSGLTKPRRPARRAAAAPPRRRCAPRARAPARAGWA